MAQKVSLSLAYASAQANAGGRLADNGFLRIYGGQQPSSVDVEVDGQPLLAELRFGPTAGVAIGGEFIFARIMPEKSARASGKATWYRALTDAGIPLLDGSVGGKDSGAALELDRVMIVEGAIVSIEDLRWRVTR